MNEQKFPKMTEKDKAGIIAVTNMSMRGDVAAGQAACFQLLGKAVHDGAVTKDDVWDILVGTYHSDEEYLQMMENPDIMAMLGAILM